MNIRSTALWALALFTLTSIASAEKTDDRVAEVIKLVKNLKYQHGDITIENGLATIHVPQEFNYLDKENAKIVLEQLWGNPPSDDTLGMLLPSNMTPLNTNCWAVTISYSNDGYVKDKDASTIDYNDLLKKMQKGAQAANKEREKEGYPSIELIGWAAPPRYDAETHKLYWAKELKFGDDPDHTLNYNIRMLGRRGVLVLNVIGGMPQLAEIEKNTPQILSMVNFNEGHRYADFNGKTDKVAAYGIAALVAGGLAAKMGFFKLLWVGLLAAKKFVIIAIVAIAGFVKRLFNRKSSTT